MTVKFNNIKNLDSNRYNKIVIIENPETNKYVVDVESKKNKCDGDNFTLPQKFSKRIKYFSAEVKIIETVRYFLDNHKINSIKDEEVISYNSGLFSCIHSKNCFLALRVFSNPELMRECIKKYIKDRNSCLIEECNRIFHYELWTRFGESSYHQYNFGNDSYMIFHFKISKWDLWEMDKSFLKDFPFQKLQEQGEIAKIVGSQDYLSESENYVEGNPKLICGKLSISFTDEVLRKYIEEVMNDYNQSLEKNKVLKLKMEGF